eukprot:XP_010659435.1 PREDICTED: putative disease resistance protein RGA4 isoform X3 [Vitis vinifera]
MAEQIVYGVDNLLMKVGCVAVEEIGLMYGVPKELTKLQETLSTIKDVILDAEEQQQISELGRSRAIESWVRRLKDVVYDADDLFDDLAAEDLRRKTDVRGRFGRRVPSFPCLKELWLDNTSTELCLQLISVSSSLKSLYISEIDDLISLPEGLRHLTSLKSLIIDNCDSLPQGIQYLTVLESLDIINCREVNLSDDDGLQFQGLRSLRHLYLGWIRKWVSLPKGLQHVSTLETLELNRLYDLATLPNWIASLTSLTKLSLEECPKLTSLPEEMRSLNNLHTLKISYCRNLVKRCKKEAGEDWPRISHIPEIIIRE